MIHLKADIEKRPRRLRHRLLKVACATTVVTLLTVALFPVTAHAETPGFTLLDLGASLKNMICYWLLEGACCFFNVYNSVITSISGNTILAAPFSSMLGVDMYNLTHTVYETAIVPLAESILALFMLVQLVKISQRVDATATLPAVKEVIFLAVVYVLLHWFIVNALDIMQGIYQIVVDDIIPNIGSAASGTGFFDGALTTDPITNDIWDSMSIGGALLAFIESILSLLIGFIAYIVALVVAYARAWQIYVYAAFSAIPVALLGFDETRQMGISFLKNFASACLAGAVMMFLLVAYPYIISGLSPDGAGLTILTFVTVATGAATGSAASGLLLLLQFLATSILLILGLLKSGSWAKEILGG